MAKDRPVRGAPLNDERARFNLPRRESDGDWRDDRAGIDDGPVSHLAIKLSFGGRPLPA